jgi:hypothetical protein
MKLQYDPQRLIKLRKNEILNQFRTQFSQKFYEVFKDAERRIWSDNDRNFEFVDVLVQTLEDELLRIKNNLDQKLEAWSSVEKAETNNTSLVSRSVMMSNKPQPQVKQNAFSSAPPETQNLFAEEDFNFFDEE